MTKDLHKDLDLSFLKKCISYTFPKNLTFRKPLCSFKINNQMQQLL